MNKEERQKNIKKFQGQIVSTKMNASAVVEIVSIKTHAKYGKKYKSTRKYNCHNAGDQYRLGDKVTFIECRPMSKTKRWRIIAKTK
ncbi:MAG: 30S ribosomal protein S17 [Parcubacteria group bacterium CG1_02_37_51]|uniref:30S ribosomal protein S17 n=2 Tax=Candidatus Komeiliibacteriota TaxID=1817908 RepID=A0A2M8DRM4_9BACT|nr:MAG: 30S ribosomal protein S17 [Parcubacteria group bacterium CG1_02_37_51]PIY94822.1 MAG: 30S ribosomal protein S17 [Candidatus Komeilibacteria bacterium CG_4_10_14_0_8_um_filter_37_78]PJC01986.1 MAG: 30S ribosomal protein S17 [Candidatus Komeilibacteria bacterium CG_4_9_14_0_8_um_filter_36_9]